MGHLNNAKPLKAKRRSRLWAIYGKSGSGKTAFLGTFPKPMLYLQFGDDGAETLDGVEGVDCIVISSPKQLKEIITEAYRDTKYKTVACDTFSLIVQEWCNENAIAKKKRMTQQMWGDLKTDSEELVRMFHKLAETHVVALTFHETADGFEGLEDEILPEIRVSLSKGARTYMESMANFGVHTAILLKETEDDEGESVIEPVYAAHLGPNPYYWTKFQKPPSIKMPVVMPNPSYRKIMRKLKPKEQ